MSHSIASTPGFSARNPRQCSDVFSFHFKTSCAVRTGSLILPPHSFHLYHTRKIKPTNAIPPPIPPQRPGLRPNPSRHRKTSHRQHLPQHPHHPTHKRIPRTRRTTPHSLPEPQHPSPTLRN